MNHQDDLILKLCNVGAVKFGEFTLKSGIISPIYLDLRVIVSYPDLLRQVAEAMWEKVQQTHFDLICGVPYTALPIATVISLLHNKPMIMRRKEVKEYGTKKIIEGNFSAGQSCLVVEDLVTSGSSVFETIEPLEHEGLKVKDVVVLIDREQGGKNHLAERGYRLHAVTTISSLLNTLQLADKISSDIVKKVQDFIAEHQV